MIIASPVIQTVTSGTDWPAIAAVVSTGIVGLAGIGTTLWQVIRNWGREDKRAKINEKRRLYAAFIACLQKGLEAAVVNHSASKQDSDLRDYGTVLMTALSTFYELTLIAPRNVIFLSGQAMTELTNFSLETAPR